MTRLIPPLAPSYAPSLALRLERYFPSDWRVPIEESGERRNDR